MILTNPDCIAGKHRACDATGFDADADTRIACPCACHAETIHGVPLAEISRTIQLAGVHDDWSVLVLRDGGLINRWANDAGTGPIPGHERRYEATARYILDERPRPE